MTPTPRRGVRLAAGLTTLFAAGIAASVISTSSAATRDDCIVIQCPTIPTPTLPVSVPLGATTTTATTPTGTTSSAAAGMTTPQASNPSGAAAPASGQPAASTAFSYTVSRVSVKRTSGARRLAIEVALSQPATIVSVLHRGGVPSLVDVRGGQAGTTKFTLALDRRIKAGRYTLRLVFAKAEERFTYTRRVAVPR
jgi:hypothetical protein